MTPGYERSSSCLCSESLDNNWINKRVCSVKVVGLYFVDVLNEISFPLLVNISVLVVKQLIKAGQLRPVTHTWRFFVIFPSPHVSNFKRATLSSVMSHICLPVCMFSPFIVDTSGLVSVSVSSVSLSACRRVPPPLMRTDQGSYFWS